MKNIKKLFVLLLLLVLVPLAVYADIEPTESDGGTVMPEPINIYLFYGDGCPHCADLETFFESIEKEYGIYYNIVDYEVWYNKENSKLMEEIADKMGDSVSGVPYLIIGHKTWNGYENDKALNKEITDAIMEEFNATERYDVFKDTEEKNNTGAIILVICIVAAGTALLWLSRKSTVNEYEPAVEEADEEELKVEKVVEEKKEVVKKEEKKAAPKKKSSSKKKSKKK